uniref:Putative secreted protein n=1 Tax=Amblyomma parvum TaxID=251391 RepID=A0A023G233_AMBPA
MILYLFALHLFVVALGEDRRCQIRYLVDDYCDSDDDSERETLFTYDQESSQCVYAESCSQETRALLFRNMQECISTCHAP